MHQCVLRGVSKALCDYKLDEFLSTLLDSKHWDWRERSNLLNFANWGSLHLDYCSWIFLIIYYNKLISVNFLVLLLSLWRQWYLFHGPTNLESFTKSHRGHAGNPTWICSKLCHSMTQWQIQQWTIANNPKQNSVPGIWNCCNYLLTIWLHTSAPY